MKYGAVIINEKSQNYSDFIRKAEKLVEAKKTSQVYVVKYNSKRKSISEDVSELEFTPVLLQEDTLENEARTMLKILLKENVKTVTVFCEKFDSRRIYLTYNKLYFPVGIEVNVFWMPSPWSELGWFANEHGIMNVTGNFFKLVLYFIKGYL